MASPLALSADTPINILFVGQTGGGKTTLRNAFEDYLKSVNFQDRHLVIRQTTINGSSDTTDYSKKIVPTPNGHNITLIDTPGLFDTKGAQQDKKNIDQIMESISSVSHLSAIVLVIHNGTNRADASFHYVINQLQQLVSKSAANCIIVMLTHAWGVSTSNDTIGVLKSCNLENVQRYRVNNYAYNEADPDEWMKLSPEDKQQNEEERMDSYVKAHKVFTNFIKHVGTIKPYETANSRMIFDKRSSLNSTMIQLKQNLKDLYEEKQFLEMEVNNLQQNPSVWNIKINSTRKMTKSIFVKKNGIVSTLCSKCQTTCHQECHVNRGETLKGCNAMTIDYCQVCMNKCHYSLHFHEGWQSKVILELVPWVDNVTKAKFINCDNNEQKKQLIVTVLQDKIRALNKEIHLHISAIKILHLELSVICLAPSYSDAMLEVILTQISNTTNPEEKKSLEEEADILNLNKYIIDSSSLKPNEIEHLQKALGEIFYITQKIVIQKSKEAFGVDILQIQSLVAKIKQYLFGCLS